MSARIGQRLTAADTEMLAAEGDGPHVSGACPWLWVIGGPCPTADEIARHLASRLPRKMRQRVTAPPWRLTRPLWVDVPGWSINDHIAVVGDLRYWSEDGWLEFISERLTVRLDRSKPLWRLWLIPHAEGSRFALVSMIHHALADGHSGVELLMLSAGLVKPGAELAPDRAERIGQTRRLRTGVELAGLAARDVADLGRVSLATARAVIAALRGPHRARLRAHKAFRALIALAADIRNHATEIPDLHSSHQAQQRVCHFDIPATQVRLISASMDCFPNDLFLSLVAAGVGCLLEHREVAAPDLHIHVWVPVNIGERDARATLGNHVSGVRVPLPVGPMRPEERLRQVRAASRRAAASEFVAGATLVTRLENALPAPALPWAARVALSPSMMHLIASHMVIPPIPEPLPGRRLLDARAWTFLPEQHKLSFAAQSLNSRLSLNYIVAAVSPADHEHLSRGMREHVDRLVEVAEGGQG